MRVQFNVNIRPALRGIQKLEESVHTEAVAEGLKAAAQVVANKAKETTTFTDRSGKTRRSIKARVKKKRKFRFGQLYSNTATTLWAERGTEKRAAKPFIVPAAQATVDDQLRAMSMVFQKYIAKIGAEARGGV